MNKIEAITEIVKTNGCQDAKAIANDVKRIYGIDVSPAEVSGSLRGMIRKGWAASSNCGYGKTVYWWIGDKND